MDDKCGDCSFPSLSTQGKNLGLSIFNVMTQAIKTGKLRATAETVEKRLEICNGCEFLKDNRCLECGCFLALKAGLHAENCPKGKW
ncbi:MAG TPA: DUF6171 family protein [Nitrosomonas sp.]|nr:DUF6171 family protein [Nitrosomonas sp.]